MSKSYKTESENSKNEPNAEEKVKVKQEPTESEDKKEAQLEEEVSKLKESLLISLAKNENAQKRHYEDLERVRKYANKKLISRFLPFLNSYEQALEVSRKMQDPKVSNF